jgi:type II secretory pathway component PulF
MVRAGEAAGALETVLNRIADAAEAEEELRSKIWTALTYPLFLSAVGILTIGVLLGVVIPRLATMFSEMGQMLPLPTRIVLAVSGGIARFGWMIAIGIGLGAAAFRRMIRSPEGKRGWDRLILKIPVIGRLILQAEIARFGRTLGTLLTQGIPMLQGLQVVRETVENEPFREDIGRVERAVAQGSSVAQATREARTIPVFAQNMISVGETSGRIEQALAKVAGAYEREVDRSVKVLTTLLEPALILFMGVIVGGIVMAMLLPIFQLNVMVR